jgi:hypothetical protein
VRDAILVLDQGLVLVLVPVLVRLGVLVAARVVAVVLLRAEGVDQVQGLEHFSWAARAMARDRRLRPAANEVSDKDNVELQHYRWLGRRYAETKTFLTRTSKLVLGYCRIWTSINPFSVSTTCSSTSARAMILVPTLSVSELSILWS